MRSPFPGMDPYLERYGRDVHSALIGYMRDELQGQLAGDLFARMEDHVYIETDRGDYRRLPDVHVVESPAFESFAWGDGGSTTAVADEPMLLLADDPVRQRSISIVDTDGERIVTAIELLSPTNKGSRQGVDEYLKKRRQYEAGEVNVVEIDLIRAGNWEEMILPYRVPSGGKGAYRVTVWRADTAGLQLYPIRLWSRLPTIAVPLRPHEKPAVLELQKLVDKAYVMGRYGRIDYAKPCEPELPEADQTLLAEALRERQ